MNNQKTGILEQRIVTSWDDYCVENRRLAQLLIEYSIPAIFFIELMPHRTGTPLDAINQIKELSALGFTIGSHTMNHYGDLKALSHDQVVYELTESKKQIEKLTYKDCKLFCYPKGRRNIEVVDAVKEAGYIYARTTEIGDAGNYSNPYEMKTSVHVYQRKEYNGMDWLEYAKQEFDRCMEEQSQFHLWGHAWEVEQYGNWHKLEELFTYISR